jgi:hypothetical protein
VMEKISRSGEDDFDFLHDMSHAAQYISDSTLSKLIDFQDLLDFRNSLAPGEGALIDSAIEFITNMSLPDIISPTEDYYCRPIKTSDHEEIIISGRVFIVEEDRHIRDYVLCGAFTVKQVFTYDSMDEYGVISIHRGSRLVGCGSNLHQAIEVSLLSLNKISEDNKLMVNDGYKIYSQELLYLDATVEVGGSGEPFLNWRIPASRAEREVLEHKLECIRVDYAQNSLADNYSTCARLSDEIDLIKEQLKDMPLNKETIISAVDHVERIMGSRSFIKRQLSNDLGM